MSRDWLLTPTPESSREAADLVLASMAEAVREVMATLDDDLEFQLRLLSGSAGSYAHEPILAAKAFIAGNIDWALAV